MWRRGALVLSALSVVGVNARCYTNEPVAADLLTTLLPSGVFSFRRDYVLANAESENWVVEVEPRALVAPGAQFVTASGEDRTEAIQGTVFYSGTVNGDGESWAWFEVHPSGEVVGTIRDSRVEISMVLGKTTLGQTTQSVTLRQRPAGGHTMARSSEGGPAVAGPAAPVTLVVEGCTGLSRRANLPALRNTSTCEVFMDGDDAWFGEWGSSAGVTQMLQALAYADATFSRDFGAVVRLTAGGTLHSLASPQPGSSASTVLTGYSSWLARGVTNASELAPDRPGGLPSPQLMCLNFLFTHTAVVSANGNGAYTIGLANVASAPSYTSGACATALAPRSDCGSGGANCTAPNGSAFVAINTAFATSATGNGLLDTGTFHLTVAHEIAHTLSAVHDDDLQHPAGAGPCGITGVSIMLEEATHNDSANANFSDCSIATVNEFVSFHRGRGTCLTGASPCDGVVCPAASGPCKTPGTCFHRDGSCSAEADAPDGTPCDTSTQVGHCQTASCVARPAGCGDRLLLDTPGTAFDGVYLRSNLTFRSRAVYHNVELGGLNTTALFFDFVSLSAGANATAGWFLGPIDPVYRLPTSGVPWLFNSTTVAMVADGTPLDPTLFTPGQLQPGVSAVEISQCSPASHLLFCQQLQVSGFSVGATNGVYTVTNATIEQRPTYRNDGAGLNLYFSRVASSWLVDTDFDVNIFNHQIPVDGALFSPAQLTGPVAVGGDMVTLACLDTTTTTAPSSAAPSTLSPTAAPTASPTAAPTASPSAAPTAVPSAAPTAPTTRAPTAPPAIILRISYAGDLSTLNSTDVDLFKAEVIRLVVASGGSAINASHIAYVNLTAGSITATVVFHPAADINLVTATSLANNLRTSNAVVLPATSAGGANRTFAVAAAVGGLLNSAAPTASPVGVPTTAPPPAPVVDGGATKHAINDLPAETQDMIYYVGFGSMFVFCVSCIAWSQGVGCGKKKKKKKGAQKKVDSKYKRKGSILKPGSPEWDNSGSELQQRQNAHQPAADAGLSKAQWNRQQGYAQSSRPHDAGPPRRPSADWPTAAAGQEWHSQHERPRPAQSYVPQHRAHYETASETHVYDAREQQPPRHYYPDR